MKELQELFTAEAQRTRRTTNSFSAIFSAPSASSAVNVLLLAVSASSATLRLMLLLLLVLGAPLGAQRRDPPLAQVKVPHSYYWREMYVPQVTSGPSSFTWSPNGQEVIYSMQGTL